VDGSGGHRAGRAAANRAEPVGVDPCRVEAGRAIGLARRVDEQVVGALVPVLAERRAAHAHDRDAVLDPPAAHDSYLSGVTLHPFDLRSPSAHCARGFAALAALAARARLPEVVVDSLPRVEAAERHLELVA